jgi:hypothetical protein
MKSIIPEALNNWARLAEPRQQEIKKINIKNFIKLVILFKKK